MAKYVFGIDVGGTTVKCGLFSIDGTVLEKWEIVTRTENNGEHILPDVAETIQAKIAERELEAVDIAGIGIGVPGPVNDKGEVPVAVNLHWGYKNVAGELRSKLGLPVYVGNDANVAALGEMWMGGGRGTKNLIMVTLGTGVGGGIIINGKILTGSHGAGGEIGHANVDPGYTKTTCNCGNQGCLEQFASATGIVNLAKEELEKADTDTCLKAETVSAKEVFDAYKAKDAVAERIVARFAEYLGNALAVFAAVVDPEVFVIGGGVSKAGQTLIDAVAKIYRRDAFADCKETPLVLAELGNDAGIYGAAKLALQ
ncbi:MAG: ROK family glucokinase [Lachnospiraceae bacterium]|nr:ROK family glucokinase [Lachnospiraceae bacterium]